MKKNILIFFGVFISFNCFAAELDALSKHVYNGWEKDKTEIGYVSTRCASLYSNIQAYFLSNGTKESDKQNAETFRKSSEQLLMLGMIAASQSGTNVENFKLRYQEISKIYLNKIILNKRLNNNIFDDVLTEELKICKVIAEDINVALKK